jgi:hypothetical protein
MATPSPEELQKQRKGFPHSAPQGARTQYGQADVQVVAGELRSVKTIRAALLEQRGDLFGVIGATGVVGLVAHKFCWERHEWHMPHDAYEAVVLLAAILTAVHALQKYTKLSRLTKIALSHVEEMIGQIEELKPRWWELKTGDIRRVLLAVLVAESGLVACVNLAAALLPLGLVLILVIVWEGPGFVRKARLLRK